MPVVLPAVPVTHWKMEGLCGCASHWLNVSLFCMMITALLPLFVPLLILSIVFLRTRRTRLRMIVAALQHYRNDMVEAVPS
jgi:hypothetical protein